MGTFFEQLRASLAPEFLLERELGSGGMATVFLAHDVALDRPVAIKAMRPEDASAAAVARFHDEAQTLARLRHAHIVPVHATGMARGVGIPFYVMDYLAGETLEQRLRHGALPEAEASRLCDQLLDALAVAHRHGIVHRDIKPSNVFLEERGAILTDFGIAKRLERHEGALTAPGQLIGTPLYSPPEQSAGREVTPQTDLHAVGMVVYEALTGRAWMLEAPAAPNWHGVAGRLRVVLERALADSPAQRWRDAPAFQRAWQAATRGPSLGQRVRPAAIAAALLGAAWLLWPRGGGGVSDLRIEALAAGGGSQVALLGDSLAAFIAQRLTGFPDFSVAGPGQPGRARDVVRGTITAAGASLRITLRLRERRFTVVTTVDDWRTGGDLLADSLLLRVFGGSALDAEVPVRVLPRGPEGLQGFLVAEKLLAASHWREAYDAYDAAITLDSTCWLCIWRHKETGRWLGQSDDSAGIRQALAHIALFPPGYQSLIRVDTLPLLARFDTLSELHQRSPAFLFGEFRHGDELMHRGPLIGRARGEAAQYFQAALNLRPDFAPAVEHQLWLAVLEADGPGAGSALDALLRISQPQQLTSGLPEMLQVAFAWQFLPAAEAEARTRAAMDEARRKSIGALDVGARYMNGFMVPHGAVWIGRRLEAEPRYGRSALIAQVFGQVQMGRFEAAARDLDRLGSKYPDPATAVLRLELDGVRRLFIEPKADSAPTALIDDLTQIGGATNQPVGLRQRARWLAEIVNCRLPVHNRTGEPAPGGAYPAVLSRLLLACHRAEAGRVQEAVDMTGPLTELTAWPIRGFPAFRTMLHLLRADWLMRTGREGSAAKEMLWAENFDQATLPSGDPQPMEVDWAFRPWARWRRVELQRSSARRADLCPLAASIERVWRGGEAPFAALADSAARIGVALDCAVPVT